MKADVEGTPEWYQFDTYRFDPHGRVMLRDQERVPLTPKVAETLRVLLSKAGELVTTETLMREVWPANVVEPGSLTRNIADLRKALGDRQHIETVPKRGYRFVTPVSRTQRKEAGPSVSVAVHPFEPLYPEHLLDDLRLAIASALVSKLNVVPECVAELVPSEGLESGKDTRAGTDDCKRILSVRGTLQRYNGTVRLNVTLLDGPKSTAVWSECLDYSLTGPASIEDIGAEEIAGAIALWLSRRHRKLLARRYTHSSRAYKLYLTGHYHLGQRSRAGLEQAIACFRQAVELDSEYALAYAGLATSYALLPMLGAVDSATYMPKARIAALNALQGDETLADARSALAFVKWHYEWDWENAERQFRRILNFYPDDSITRQWLGLLLAEQGRFTEAIEQAAQAAQSSPDSAGTRGNLATVLLFAGRRAQAAAEARRSLELDPRSVRARWVLANSLFADDHVAAVELLEAAASVAPRSPLILGALAWCSGRAGRTAEAVELLRRMESQPEQTAWAYARALGYVGLGRSAEALGCLAQAQLGRDFQMILLKVDWRLDGLRQLAGFQSLARAVGFSS
jgi:DNA-binding winged helix-turn-helix (wHTH) protein/tetratricopeptide (TPR) repeat protein